MQVGCTAFLNLAMSGAYSWDMATPLHYHRAPVRTARDRYEHVDDPCQDEGCDPWHWCSCQKCRKAQMESA